MKFLLLSIVLLSTFDAFIYGKVVKNQDFFVEQFYRLKHKYDIICKEPGAVISYETSHALIAKCLEPVMDELKKDNPKQIPDDIYPELWKDIVKKCFAERVKNFCFRTEEGKVNKNRAEWTIDQALQCAATKSYAFLHQLKHLYNNNAEKVKEVADRQKKCINDFFDNVSAHKGKYVKP